MLMVSGKAEEKSPPEKCGRATGLWHRTERLDQPTYPTLSALGNPPPTSARTVDLIERSRNLS